jgi:hypothetical protein
MLVDPVCLRWFAGGDRAVEDRRAAVGRRYVNLRNAPLMPGVDQAVPSEVHSTAGSVWKTSWLMNGSSLCVHEPPPSVERYIPWRPLPPTLFEAARICAGLR